MRQPFRRILLLAVLLTAFATPALARLVIGITPAMTPGATDPVILNAFEAEMTSRTGEPVSVRSFDSQATMLDWLIRFRELDAALVAPGLIRTLPAGTLLHLADFPQAIAVAHPGVPASHRELLSRALRSLLDDERGRQLANRLASGTKVPALTKATPAPRETRPPAPPSPKPAVQATAAVKPVAPPPAPAAKPVPAGVPQPTVKPLTPPQLPAPVLKVTVSKSQATAAKPPPAPAPVKPVEAAPPGASSGSKRPYLLLIAALVILAGIGVKVALLMGHWRMKSHRPSAPPQPPSAENFSDQTTSPLPETIVEEPAMRPVEQAVRPPAPPAVAAEPEPQEVIRVPGTGTAETAEPAPSVASPARRKRPVPGRSPDEEVFPPDAEAIVVEQGRLGKIKVPALFKRCAELPQPVVLRVRTGDNETCVHFSAGQIRHATSRNWRIDEGMRQWSKLGYLMMRDGVISEAQRDQALELIERQPKLRFAAALQQLGPLDSEALRHVLARQAKTTVYALILFSSGEYRIEADSGSVPAEESIDLQVDALIREASHHQAEWTSIRKVLPNPGTQLDFAPDGREKLEQVRLSVHQQLLLSQIDGQASIGTLCCDSTMMDYEACRFLYLMVKAGVLQVVPST